MVQSYKNSFVGVQYFEYHKQKYYHINQPSYFLKVFDQIITSSVIQFVKKQIYFNLNSIQEFDNFQIEKRDIFLIIMLWKIQNLASALDKFQETSDLSKKQKNIIALFNLIFKIVFIVHIISCIWVIIHEYEINKGYLKTWVKNDSNKDDYLQLYINAYYFTTVTMITIGFGDLILVTNLEKTISIILMIFSCGVFAYSMNTIGSILYNFNEDEVKIQQNMSVINSYMHKKNVNKKTQSAIREYLEYYWKEQSDRNQESEQKIINLLSDNLRKVLQQEAKNVIFRQSSIFRNNFSEFVRQKMIDLIKEHRATPDEIIFTENFEDDCSIYFIEKGSVEIFTDVSLNISNKQYKQIATLEQGQSFGELSFFSGQTRNMSIRSREFTTLLIVKREEFISLIKNHTDDYERFCTIKDGLNLYNSYQLLNISCLSCRKLGHLIKQCPYIHFIPKELKLRQQFMFCPKQERKNISRIVNYKQNSLQNHANVKGKAQLLQYHYDVEDSYSSSSYDLGSDKINGESKTQVTASKRFITFEQNEVSNDNKSIISPLTKQYNHQMSMDKNTLKGVSFNQFDDPRESIIIDEQQLKSPSTINHSQQIHQRDGESQKNDFHDAIKGINDYEEYFKQFIKNLNINKYNLQLNREYEDEIKQKPINNISKGILINKEYNLKNSTILNKRNSKLNSMIESNNQHSLTSLQNYKHSPYKKVKQSDYNKLHNLVNQIIQIFIPESSNYLKFNSIVETNNNQEQSSQISMNKSSSKQRRLALFQEMPTEQKSFFQKIFDSNSVNEANDDTGTQAVIYKKSNSGFLNEEQHLFLEEFDSVKSYLFYYPLNNIENQLELMCLSQEKKRQKMIRSHFDNMAGIRNKSFIYSQKKSYKSTNSIYSVFNNTSQKVQDSMLNDGSVNEERERKKSKFLKNQIHGQSSFVNQESLNQIMKKSTTTYKASLKENHEQQLCKNQIQLFKKQPQLSIENFNEAFEKYPKEKQLTKDAMENQNNSNLMFYEQQTEVQFENLYSFDKKMTTQKENINQQQHSFNNSKNPSSVFSPKGNESKQQLSTTLNQLQEINSEKNQNKISQNANKNKLDIKIEILKKQHQNDNSNRVSQNYNSSYFNDSDSDSDININIDSPNQVFNQNNIFKNTLQIIPKKNRKFQEN